MSYGLPNGTRITYGSKGFPQWVYDLGKAFNLKASTYPGHQETDRIEPGYARNPQRLNRGVDWAGSITDMQRFADYLMGIKASLEQVIWENPQNGRRTGVAGGKDVSGTNYYATDEPRFHKPRHGVCLLCGVPTIEHPAWRHRWRALQALAFGVQ